MRGLKFKSKTIVLATCATLAVAGGAFAYFSTTGSGTVSATVGTSSTVTINPTLASTTLYPGSSSSVSFTVTNGSGQSQHVATIHLASVHACPSGDTWTSSACSNGGTEIASCETVENGTTDGDTANFWMPDVTENQDVSANSTAAATSGGTVEMNNLSTSQDSCKNASLTLTFTSS